MLRGDAVAVVRDGPEGCAVHVADTTTYVPGFPQTPVDTNGAGDTHTGALLAEVAAPGAPPALAAVVEMRVLNKQLDHVLRLYVGDEPHRAILAGDRRV